MYWILHDRTYEEVPEILKKELMRQGVPEEKIIVELDGFDSLDRSLANAQKGDLLMVQVREDDAYKLELVRRLEAVAKENATK